MLPLRQTTEYLLGTEQLESKIPAFTELLSKTQCDPVHAVQRPRTEAPSLTMVPSLRGAAALC